MPPSNNIYQNPGVQIPVEATPPPPTPPNIPQQESFTTKKKTPVALIIVGIVIIVILVVFAALKLTGGVKNKSTGNVTWWGLWEDTNVVTPLINAYESSHPGVKITYVAQSPQDYKERLSSSLSKGEGPDIFTFHNTWSPMFKADLDALPSSVMTAADYSKNFYPVITSDLSYGNSIVGLPLGYDALTLYINQDIFDKSGKTPPTTWDDFRNVAKALTIKDDRGVISQAGAAMGRTENVDHWQEILALLMIQNGVDLGNPTGKNAEDALTYFTLFSSGDGIWDTTLPTSTQAFAAGKLAMYIAPSWRTFEITQKNPNLKFKTVPIPQLPKDNPAQLDITYATYWAQGVWSKSASKSTAWDFLNYLATTDSLQKLYQNETAVRSFGEAYPRTDMASLLTNHPILGSIITQAPGARSWYLASRTFDGATGINTQVSNYFGDAVNAVVTGKSSAAEALATVAQGVAQVMAQYGISVR